MATTIWAFSCPHANKDKDEAHRDSLAGALRDIRPYWGSDASDFAVCCGDFTADGEGGPTAEAGDEVIRQFKAFGCVQRSKVYPVCGNHDRPIPSGVEGEWFRRYADPLGEFSESTGAFNHLRPYPISLDHDGAWDRYAIQVGNMRWLFMSDRLRVNNAKRGIENYGGDPGGVIRTGQYNWLTAQLDEVVTDDLLCAVVHHYMLRNTTVASGDWEGVVPDGEGGYEQHYHGTGWDPKGVSHLYYLNDNPDAQLVPDLIQEKGAPHLWIGGHTHAPPDDTHGGRSHIETKWGCHHINCATLSEAHGTELTDATPMSRLITLTDGSANMNVKLFLHNEWNVGGGVSHPKGFLAAYEQTLVLPQAFQI